MRWNLPGAFALVLFSFSLSLFGQVKESSKTACETLFAESQQLFNAGLLGEIDEIGLRGCMRNQSREYFSRVSKLLILKYLYLDQDSIARSLLVVLLKTQPEFAPDPADPRELKEMYAEYNTVPIFMIGTMVGGNLSDVQLINRYSIGSSSQSQTSYRSVSSYQYRLTAARQLTPSLFFELGVSYAVRRFRFKEELVTDANPTVNFTSLTFIEHQQWWDIPIGIQYQFPGIPLAFQGKLVPYVSGGISTHLLINSRLDDFRRLADTRNNDNPPQVELTTEGEKINIYEHRRFLDGAFHLGGGVMSKLKLGYLVLDVRYRHGIRSLADPSTRYGSGSIPYLFGYVDDDFSIRDFSLSIGYIRNFYRPELTRKVKKLIQETKKQ
ncbi:MAG: hypothetical protein AAF587_02575 [Bacteroidota bacterium]